MQAGKRSQAPVPSQEVVEIKRTDKTGNERVVGSVITARDRWLKPGGVILPSNAMVFSLSLWSFNYCDSTSLVMRSIHGCCFNVIELTIISTSYVVNLWIIN
ncbi:probable protein arginine N-methyltransferase 6 isoform X3 [Rosa chinensis]|uniref:probable protein arginine N-methyltransferase 6 isoform X3 n=1 Tax=Rosa chinensis TaxID=74649 RepID=UPI001AD94957|nr:probable protein arginine N-methyltransferase 6 isoform X3 [Rosa chinensis]